MGPNGRIVERIQDEVGDIVTVRICGHEPVITLATDYSTHDRFMVLTNESARRIQKALKRARKLQSRRAH